jgi:hypothetical protein
VRSRVISHSQIHKHLPIAQLNPFLTQEKQLPNLLNQPTKQASAIHAAERKAIPSSKFPKLALKQPKSAYTGTKKRKRSNPILSAARASKTHGNI